MARLLVAPRVFRAPEGPAAREARASLRSAPRLEARPCPPHQWGQVAVVWFGALFWRLSGPRRCLHVPPLGTAGQVVWLSETGIAFACECLRGIETAIAFAREN